MRKSNLVACCTLVLVGSKLGCSTGGSSETPADAAPVMDASSEDEGATDASDGGHNADASSATCVRGLDTTISTTETSEATTVLAKGADSIFVGRRLLSYAGDCPWIQPYTVLAQANTGTLTDSEFNRLCVAPPGSYWAKQWEARSIAYSATTDQVALTGSGDYIFVASVSGADPRWTTKSQQTPDALKWGVFPTNESDDPPGSPVGQQAYGSAIDGARIRVVGNNAANEGLSLLFEDGESGIGAALVAKSLVENRIKTFYSIAVAPAGVAYAVGVTQAGSPGVVKLTSSNTVDETFGTQGLATLAVSNTTGAGVAMSPSGQVIVLASHGSGELVLTKIDQGGVVDLTFGESGSMAIPLVHPFGRHLDIGIGSDSSIFVGGLARNSDGIANRGALARVLPTGVLDPSYGVDGIAAAPLFAQKDGKAPNRVLLAITPDASLCTGHVTLFVGVDTDTPRPMNDFGVTSYGYGYTFTP